MGPCLDPRTGYTFTLEGAIVPKARPRVTARGTFMPPAYRTWKDGAIATLRSQAIQQGIFEPIAHAAIAIELHGKHPRRSDCDNLAGALLDALVQAEILKNDNLTVVPSLAIALRWSRQPAIALITLEN